MSNQITLETLKLLYQKDEFIIESIRHNLNLYLKHITSKEICNEKLVNFDMRKDYWNNFEMVVLIKYTSEVFYKKHLKPKLIRSCLYDIFSTYKVERLNGRFKKFPLGFGEVLNNKENVKLFLNEIIDIAKKSNWNLDNDVLEDLKIEEESLSLHFINYVEEIKKMINDDDVSNQLSNVPLIKKMPYFAYISANDKENVENHLMFFKAWYTLLTSTNAYGAGAQVFGPIIGNSNTSDLFECIIKWSEGRSIIEAPFEAFDRKSVQKKDFSNMMTVIELYGFCRLEKQPFINNAVIESYHSLVGVSDSIDVVATNVSKLLESIDLQDNEFERMLLSNWEKTNDSLKSLEFSNVAMETIEGKKLSKKYENEFEDLIDRKYEKIVTDLAKKLIDATPDSSKIKILKNLLIDAYFRNNLNKSEDFISPNEKEIGLNKKDKQVDKKGKSFSKNTILFGPPGTGKTYSTIKRAIEIANPDFIFENKKRDEIKNEFDRLKINEQIVFATFHQSMSYEDFIEGIKPVVEEDIQLEGSQSIEKNGIKYEVQDGIFKKLCERAKKLEINTSDVDIISDKITYYKMSLGGKNRDNIHDYCISENVISLGWGGDEDLTEFTKIEDASEYRRRFAERFPKLVEDKKFNVQATRFFLKMRKGDIVIISKGNKIIDSIGVIVSDYFYDIKTPIEFCHFRKVKWLAKNLNSSPDRFVSKKISQQSIYEFYSQDVKRDAIKELIKTKKESRNQEYVIIIDEINRGNVSQIFGELITLIEEDKRLGGSEALEVVLPYSKEYFGVPKNVYILGTMNTADRSVEALDTALRRRFSFEEMAPDLEVLSKENKTVDDIELVKLLETINKRIEVLLNKDHLIGHSFFLKVKKIEDLKHSFRNEIIPLLQEYFYGDFGKIGLVLGEKFITSSKADSRVFAKFNGYESSDYDDRPIYQITNFKDSDGKDLENDVIKVMIKSIYE